MNQTTEKEKPKRWKLVLLGLLMILLAGMTVANIQRGLTSQIYLYGEEHSQQRILDEELEIWGGYYARGMRLSYRLAMPPDYRKDAEAALLRVSRLAE